MRVSPVSPGQTTVLGGVPARRVLWPWTMATMRFMPHVTREDLAEMGFGNGEDVLGAGVEIGHRGLLSAIHQLRRKGEHSGISQKGRK